MAKSFAERAVAGKELDDRPDLRCYVVGLVTERSALRSLETFVARERVPPLEPLAGSTVCVIVPTLVRLALVEPLGAALPSATYFPTVLPATLV